MSTSQRLRSLRLSKSQRSNQKVKKSQPETALDFFESAIELEESGDRWRLNPEKCLRFYEKAIAAYGTCLQKQPNDADALYNQARVYLHIVIHCDPLYSNAVTFLLTALQLATQALTIKANDTDCLFNMAQTYSMLGEIQQERGNTTDARSFLTDALRVSHQCLELVLANQGNEATSTEDDESYRQAREDIIVLIFHLASLVCDSDWLTEDDYRELSTKIEQLLPHLQDGNVLFEWELAKRQWLLTKGKIPISDFSTFLQWYDQELEKVPVTQTSNPLVASSQQKLRSARVQLLCDKADALRGFADALLQIDNSASGVANAWNSLSAAGKALQEASVLDPNHTRIWISRGDLELRRAVIPLDVARNSSQILYKNALIFYEKAFKLQAAKTITRTFAEIVLKHLRAQQTLAQQPTPLAVLTPEQQKDILETLD
ncbi:fungal protein [Schizosaccharomyces japonicus yFS275]|uniref:Fungal protein n=1 Tax=Schizosaccharomyces japonicus (strain yFS275 / FY16936) TaxID=402676 RepID=B6JYK5_SCHJY|nr:fungal protein [Schizosaccharomyces japonicus yFS275]EEB06623.1 fungal protein [Schizosaccharomyces japonicus yFS275]